MSALVDMCLMMNIHVMKQLVVVVVVVVVLYIDTGEFSLCCQGLCRGN